MNAKFDVVHYLLGDGRESVKVRGGYRGKKHIVPPAGEDYAFDVDQWAREVEVYVSATGRSVRVWVDGAEVKQ